MLLHACFMFLRDRLTVVMLAKLKCTVGLSHQNVMFVHNTNVEETPPDQSKYVVWSLSVVCGGTNNFFFIACC